MSNTASLCNLFCMGMRVILGYLAWNWYDETFFYIRVAFHSQIWHSPFTPAGLYYIAIQALLNSNSNICHVAIKSVRYTSSFLLVYIDSVNISLNVCRC